MSVGGNIYNEKTTTDNLARMFNLQLCTGIDARRA